MLEDSESASLHQGGSRDYLGVPCLHTKDAASNGY